MQLENLIGNTPLIKLETFSHSQVNIFAKLEGQNIGGSIKDRVALALINDLEKKHSDLKLKTILEPSSGNTGIGLAMLGAVKGYRVKILLPQFVTPERISILKTFGAEVELCSSQDWINGSAIEKIKRLTHQHPEKFVMPNQYENLAGMTTHYHTTGAEILQQCPQVTHFFSVIGTGGTITGIAKKLKESLPNVKVIGLEVKKNSRIPGPRNIEDYIPPILDFQYIDQRIMIENEEEVFELHHQLVRQEGLFYGLSSAAALWGTLRKAVQLQKDFPRQKFNLVVIFPDRGEKYLNSLNSLTKTNP